MKVASLADVKARLSAYIEELPTGGPVIITRNGKTAAVLIAPEDDEDLERLLLARSPHFQALLNKSRQSIEAGKGLPRAEFWKAVKRRDATRVTKR
ncbi:MAG: type II toxin-antitoxin system Phd/YefM family antitoxin [Chloroflexi bacterium]|nr:type II toxin-antitoxin system Phd/YefM family antitoxin [Chloroflexota bacterium]